MGHSESELLDVASIREDFPILQREFGGQQVVYLDNAATTQTPNRSSRRSRTTTGRRTPTSTAGSTS
ncbi:hypothetical protein ACFQL1_07750 [Halomicroarcula sp. GCM10025709]|uniref:hypothetical protein n=1 Tax=Halomicroarcula sp. GCM10025709 TaxID=3252669 RepID=UPI00361A6C7F